MPIFITYFLFHSVHFCTKKKGSKDTVRVWTTCEKQKFTPKFILLFNFSLLRGHPLTHFSPTFKGFLMLSGGVEMEHWSKIGYWFPQKMIDFFQIPYLLRPYLSKFKLPPSQLWIVYMRIWVLKLTLFHVIIDIVILTYWHLDMLW